MIIETTRFGTIDINEERIFTMVLPIIGFDELQQFILLDSDEEKIFKWFQSVEAPSIAFPIVSLHSLNIDYTLDIPDNAVDVLKIKSAENVLVMNMAVIPQDDPHGTTVNLLAPLIFNLEEKLAGQIILSGSGYEVSYPLFKAIEKGTEC